ncbi:hypothetical protein F2P81_008287 [Scophthalmus maximus]|uniref:Uncharacterized protein n=1 Tax=Scophthalmus maximus TaxID=52904 RepID=A0A6A4TCX5_SCOMX|nr:hypothetical protein F2P81_008287 [Scophthalmus maximus]
MQALVACHRWHRLRVFPLENPNGRRPCQRGDGSRQRGAPWRSRVSDHRREEEKRRRGLTVYLQPLTFPPTTSTLLGMMRFGDLGCHGADCNESSSQDELKEMNKDIIGSEVTVNWRRSFDDIWSAALKLRRGTGSDSVTLRLVRCDVHHGECHHLHLIECAIIKLA